MPKFFMHRIRLWYVLGFGGVSLITILLLMWVNHWLIGIFSLLLLVSLGYMIYRTEKQIEEHQEDYISTLTYRIKKVGEDVVSEIPIGILLYDEDRTIIWHNRYTLDLLGLEQPS